MWLKERRRNRLRTRALPPEWKELMLEHSLIWRHLPPEDQRELSGHIQVFVAEKRFEGAGGLALRDEMRVLIASQACLLLLHREADYFPGLYSIIVYPSQYLAPRRERDQVGAVIEGVEARTGETWPRGTLVLAWDAVQAGAAGAWGCRNVVIHEFAHQLDHRSGEADGAPPLSQGLARRWPLVWKWEYERHRTALARGLPVDIDPYGTKSPAEFFAVVVEAFFMCPRSLKDRHPQLYQLLGDYFRQDPATWLPR